MILVDNNNVLQISGEITRYGDENNPYEKGVIFFGNAGFGLKGQKTYDVEAPTGVEPHKYCYTEEKGFYPNPDYVEPKPYTKEQYDAVLVSLIEEGRL